ncbi:hypothetical protein SNE35_14685 [Paucibacter sp. R3-3]|uniref:Transposase n=1 Tax=Roseateles agri TaxID=3098619 RepID=A0ABU5DHY2_9BURK|nr:hypothetical protein [Paucibacter sp. R3-3]MDY0745764.1 hypothetical protein [Paucibacter sp. R3-3]
MAIAPFIRQFAAFKPGWFGKAPFEPLQAWLNRIVSSELSDAVMTKLDPWPSGDVETVF